MKVKMKEHYQDARVHYSPNQVVEVDKNLGTWLVDNRKAEEVIEQHYGAQPEPQERHDEELYPRHMDVEPQFEQEEPPQPKEEKKPKRLRRNEQ